MKNKLFYGLVLWLKLCLLGQANAQFISEKRISDSIQTIQSLDAKVEAYLYFSNKLIASDVNLSKKITEKALELSISGPYKVGEIKANLALAWIYNDIEPSQSLRFFDKAYQLAKKYEYHDLLIDILERQADYYIRWNQFEEASKYISEAMIFISQKKMKRKMPYMTMASIMAGQNKIKDAVYYYQKAIAEKRKKQEDGIPSLLSDLGNLYYRNKQYDVARKYYLEGLAIAQETQSQRDFGYLSDNVGLSFYREKKYRQAIPWQLKGLNYRRKIQSKLDIIANLNNIGNTYLSLHQYDSAFYYANESFELSSKFNEHIFLKEVSELLANTYKGMGNLDSAFAYQNLAYQYLDSIAQKQQKQAAKIAFVRMEASKQVLDNELLKAKNRQLSLIGILLVTFLLGFGTMIIFIWMQNKKRKKLTEKLNQTNEKLIQVDRFKDMMTGMIVHDLKNPLNTVLSISTHPLVLQAGKQMLNLTLNILDVQKFENASIHLTLSDQSLLYIIQKALSELEFLVERKNLMIVLECEASIVVKTDEEILKRVFVNLLTNAVKFSPNNGKISIIAKNRIQDILVEVKDEGKGIANENLASIFERYKQVEAKNSGLVGSTGLGLAFCKMAIEAQEGKIWADSELGKGTSFYFTLLTCDANVASESSNLDMQPIDLNVLQQDFLKATPKPLVQAFVAKASDLKKVSVYEYSDVQEILQSININHTFIEIWKKQMDNALRACNEDNFNHLVDMVV